MKKIFSIMVLLTLTISMHAQQKTVVLDISHETDSAYTFVNPNIFEQYKELVGGKIGAHLIINGDKEVDRVMLANTDLLIVLSPLKKDRITPKNNLTSIEREAIVNYVKNGGKLILFMDEEDRVDMKLFGGNDIAKPFGMEYGPDLPMKPNIGATSLITEIVKNKYELSYSGSRSLTGGTPLSLRNGDEEIVHGAYVKLDNGGTIVAFAETMVGLFMGGVEMKMPDGNSIVWRGKDDKLFMQELIGWMLQN